MQPPSDNWKRIRRAALERAQRTAIDPLSPLYDFYLGVCAVYFAGFLHFNFVAHGADLNLFTAGLLIAAAVAGVLIPLLTGSVITLHFASQRLERLMNERI